MVRPRVGFRLSPPDPFRSSGVGILVVPWSSKPVKRVRFSHSAPKLGPLIANGKQPALQAGNRGSIPRRSTKFGALVEKYSGCDESVRRFVSCFRDRRRVVRAAGCDPAHESSMSPQGRARSSTGKSAAVLTRRPRVRVSPRAPEREERVLLMQRCCFHCKTMTANGRWAKVWDRYLEAFLQHWVCATCPD